MGTKLVRVSDLTGKEGETGDFGALVVQHPEFREAIRLDVLPSEIEALLKSSAQAVQVDYTAPGESSSQRLLVLLDEFNAVAGERDMNAILEDALQTSQAERERTAAAGMKAARDGRKNKPKVNYASLEHAGEAHRGLITEAEKALVRDHLEAVNERLAREGKRTIDPADPKMRERYGL